MSISEDKTELIRTKRNKRDIDRNNLPFQRRQTVCNKSMSRQRGRPEGLMCWDALRRFYHTTCNAPAGPGPAEVTLTSGFSNNRDTNEIAHLGQEMWKKSAWWHSAKGQQQGSSTIPNKRGVGDERWCGLLGEGCNLASRDFF